MEEEKKVKELEAQKLVLIEKYMKMQDDADELNERIYHICIDIEALNLKITKAQEELEKKKALLAKGGSAAPANGKTRHDGAGQTAGRRDPDQSSS